MKNKEHKKAITLRREGNSLSEISKKLRISKGTASVWLRDISIKKAGKVRLSDRIKDGHSRSHAVKNKIRADFFKQTIKKNKKLITRAPLNRGIDKLYCSLLYWCEGNKDNNSIRFTNSDPRMVKVFLALLRKSYSIHEKRLRICMHLHDYHSESKQKKFWSCVTGIPGEQFIKTYKKHHTGKRIRKDYQGCISVRYGDNNIAKELNNLWQLFAEKCGGA